LEILCIIKPSFHFLQGLALSSWNWSNFSGPRLERICRRQAIWCNI